MFFVHRPLLRPPVPDKDDSDKDAAVEVALRQMSQNNHIECPEAEE